MLFNQEQINKIKEMFRLIYSTGSDARGVIFLDTSEPVVEDNSNEELDPLFIPIKKKREVEYGYKRVIKTGLTYDWKSDKIQYVVTSYVTPEYEPILINLESIYTLIDSDKLEEINNDLELKELISLINLYIMDSKYIQYEIQIKQ